MKIHTKRILTNIKKIKLIDLLIILGVTLLVLYADFNKGIPIIEYSDFTDIAQSGYSIEENRFYVIDTDPQIYLQNEKMGKFLEIRIQSKSRQEIPIQIFYMDNHGKYEENRSQKLVFPEGKKSFTVWFDRAKTDNLRLDIGIQNQQFEIQGIYIKNKGIENPFFEIFKIIIINVLIYLLLFIMRQNKDKLISCTELLKERINRNFTCFFFLAFAGMIAVMYGRYLIGNKYFLFFDIGADSYFQTYPELIQYARHVTSGEFSSVWDFTRGLGEPSKIFFPNVHTWTAYFGEKNIAYLLGISQMLKIFGSGFFFYKYLICMKTERYLAGVLTVGYAFCGHMIIRSSWQFYPNEVLIFAIWLYSFECVFERKEFRWFPLGTFFLVFNILTAYYYILYFLIIEAYMIFRYASEGRISRKSIIQICGLSLCVVMMFILGSGGQCITQIIESLQSSRFNTGINRFGSSNITIWADIKTAFFRTIGNDIIGINSVNYSGKFNYLEDPTFYCGISSLILACLAMSDMNKRKRRWYIYGYIVAGFYIIITPFRIVANGFVNDTFKISSFWIIVFLLLTAAQKGKENE